MMKEMQITLREKREIKFERKKISKDWIHLLIGLLIFAVSTCGIFITLSCVKQGNNNDVLGILNTVYIGIIAFGIGGACVIISASSLLFILGAIIEIISKRTRFFENRGK